MFWDRPNGSVRQSWLSPVLPEKAAGEQRIGQVGTGRCGKT